MIQPFVSIILPTYNGNHIWLSQAIKSVLSQIYENRELIIINDASTNNIEYTILEYQEREPRIKYYKNESNIQLTKTLNKGIALSKGMYIARIDDDDIWFDPMKLEKQIKFMEANQNVGLCWTSVIDINEEGEDISYINVPQSDRDIRDRLMRFNQFAHASVVFRQEVVQTVWFYDPIYNGAEDYELRLRIGTRYKFANLPDYCIKYRHNTKGISAKKKWKQGRYGIKIAHIYRHYYPYFWYYIIPRLIILLFPRYLITLLIKWLKK